MRRPWRLSLCLAVISWTFGLTGCTGCSNSGQSGAAVDESSTTSRVVATTPASMPNPADGGESQSLPETIDLTITGTVFAWTPAVGGFGLATFEDRPAAMATVEVLRLGSDQTKLMLLATKTTDGDGHYETTLNGVSPSDVLLVVSHRQGSTLGQVVVPLLSQKEYINADGTLTVDASIARMTSVAAALLVWQEIDLTAITGAQLSAYGAEVAAVVGELGDVTATLSVKKLAEILRDSPEITSRLGAALGQDLTTARDPVTVVAWDFTEDRQPISEIFPVSASLVGVAAFVDGAALSEAILGSSVLTLTGTDVAAPVTAVTISFSPNDGAPSPWPHCYSEMDQSYDPLCPTSVVAPLEGDGSWNAAYDTTRLVDDTRYEVTLCAQIDVDTCLVAKIVPFIWDAEAPDATFTIGAGDPALVTSRSVGLYVAAADSIIEYRAATSADLSTLEWLPFEGSPIDFELDAAEGPQTVYLELKDHGLNTSTVASDAVTVDTVEPETTVTTAALAGPETFAGANHQISGTAADWTSGVARVWVAIERNADGHFLNAAKSGFTGTSRVWLLATGQASWELLVPDALLTDDATYTVTARAEDAAGLLDETPYLHTLTWSVNSLVAEFSIGAGNPAAVANAAVSLVLTDDVDVVDYRAADGSDCSAASWTPYGGGPIAFTLVGGEGPNTVCLQTRDALARVSTPVAVDNVILDQSPPVSTVQTSGTLGPSSDAGATTVMTGTSVDAVSSVASVKISLRAEASGKCLNVAGTGFSAACPIWRTASGTAAWSIAFADTLFVDGQNYTVMSQAVDSAGNVESPAVESTFTWDGAPPDATFTIEASDPDYVTNSSVALVLAGSTVDVNRYRASNSADCSSAPWQNFVASPITWSLSAGDGPYTVCLEVADIYDNRAVATDTVTLDTVPPSSDWPVLAALGPASTAGANTQLAGSASDANSGITAVEVSVQRVGGGCLNSASTNFNAVCPSWLPAPFTTSWTLDVADSRFTEGATYEVSTRATDGAGLAETGVARGSFVWDKTAPAAFAITAPSTTTTVSAVVVSWQAASGADHYRVAVSTAADCSSPSQVDSAVTSTSKTLTALADGAYYICVTAIDQALNETAASNAPYAFTLDATPPGAFTVASPSAPTVDDTPLVSWSAAADVDHYDLVIDNDAACDSPVLSYSNLVATSQTLDPLAEGDYYICVAAVDAAGNPRAATNDPFPLTIDKTAPAAFQITAPAERQTTDQPVLAWEEASGRETFSLTVARLADCSDVVQTVGDLDALELQIAPLVDGQYYACVTASDAAGNETPATNQGFAFTISHGEWTTLVNLGEPSARRYHTALAVDDKVIVWGGASGAGSYLGNGAIYDPATTSWQAVETLGAPAARARHSAVWTGTRMLIFGGQGAAGALPSGGLYDPVGATWSAIAAASEGRLAHFAVWTGDAMIVWGGLKPDPDAGAGALTEAAEGLRYDLTMNDWTPLASDGEPSARQAHVAVWTGDKMIVWGGVSGGAALGDGAIYDPATDTWQAMTGVDAPSPRQQAAGVWTGSRLIVWGGANGNAASYLGDGAAYDPATDQWQPLQATGAPSARLVGEAGWIDGKMIIWGGYDATILGDGAVYEEATDSWYSMTMASKPSSRQGHTVTSLQDRVVIWGGHDGTSALAGGAEFTP